MPYVAGTPNDICYQGVGQNTNRHNHPVASAFGD